MVLVDLFIEAAQKGYCLQILVAAVNVRHPVGLLPRVVEIQHRGHGIHTQAVGVINIHPVEGAAEQKAAHLVAAVVENVAVPIGMEALERAGMFEKMSPVKKAE